MSDPHAKYKPGYIAPEKSKKTANTLDKKSPIVDGSLILTSQNNQPEQNLQTEDQKSEKTQTPTVQKTKLNLQQYVNIASSLITKNKKIVIIGISSVVMIAGLLLSIKFLPNTAIFSSFDKTSTNNNDLTNSSAQYTKHQQPEAYIEKRKIFMQHFLNNDPKMKSSFSDLMALEDIFSERLLGASVGDLLLLWPEQKSIDIANQYMEGLAQRAAQKYRTTLNMVEKDFINCNDTACQREKEEVIREVNRHYLTSTYNVSQLSYKAESIKLWRLSENTDQYKK